MKQLLGSMSIIIALCLSVSAGAAEKVVRLATLTDFAPYCFKKESSAHIAREVIPPGKNSLQLQGYSWDVVREIFHAMDYTIELRVVPWSRVMHYLRVGKVDAIFPANRTAAREEIFIFSRKPVDTTRMVVYTPAPSSLQWRDLSSLNGLRVGAVRGWAYGKKWEDSNGMDKVLMDTILQSFQVMDKARVDAVIGYEQVYDYVLSSNEISDKYKKIGQFGRVVEYLMAQKHSTVAQRIVSDFDRGYLRLERGGGLEKIMQKWQ
ncbi:MAG: substrate-binding periplasmic protein [Desulfopila sp.]